ncbi:putative 5-hydroxytryptamine receptor [Schistosoma mansoni]|uniref:putative 5-hydroxytryptamine receptor n=1 Tax=Schistosoma mansoni TaxID=6183 RepID=UPI0001A64494|nr:putative 5-hydroxytryptamine receptor [Schistosoma mansoni]|eukprot:XP_018651383.1 putative 5-hydroxytryptamine receptor [Schistosoma mansoni]
MKISVTYPNWAFLILSIIFLFITLLTAIGNALVFAALFRFRKLRTTSNLLIGNLALSDLLLAITVLPISATTDATGIWLFGPVMCDIWLTIDVFYCTASVWSLVTIAFDRFTATTFPIWYRGNKNRRRVICYILFVWILSGLICLPGLLVLNHYECVLFTEAYYIVYSAMGSFIIPFIIMIILYAKIFFILQQRTRLIRQSRRIHNKSLLECMIIHEKPLNEQSIDKNLLTIPNTSTSLISSMTTTKPILTNIKIAVDAPNQVMERAEQRERRATKRMGLIIIIFALSWIPFTLMYLVRGLCGEQFCPDISDLRKFVTWLGYVNSTINPILYALFNVHFRQAFIYFLKCTHINSHERHHQQQQQDHEKSILMKLPPPPPPPLSQQQQ